MSDDVGRVIARARCTRDPLDCLTCSCCYDEGTLLTKEAPPTGKAQRPREGFHHDEPHRDGCAATRQQGKAPIFTRAGGTDHHRDQLGRKQGSTPWFRFRCSDTSCPAVLLVREDVLAKFINR